MVAWFAFLILTGIAHYPQIYFMEVLMGIMVLTAATRYCPLLAVFGINTLERKKGTQQTTKE